MKKILNPWVVTTGSIIISVVIYLIINYFAPMKDYNQGLLISIIIPAIVAYPVSKVLFNYNNKISKQNDEIAEQNEALKRSYGDITELTEKINTIEAIKRKSK